MPYGETKIYYDGSHYIAIPHTTRPQRPRRHSIEETITVTESKEKEQTTESTPSIEDVSFPIAKNQSVNDVQETENIADVPISECVPNDTLKLTETLKTERKMTRKEYFNEQYRKSMDLPKHSRKKMLIESMRPYFKSDAAAELYVTVNLERKLRNLIARRVRCNRKVNLQEFNYFVTLTYDNALHSEESFRKKLRNTLSHFCSRKNWRYVGVWERSPENKRLHFHGIFYIPNGTMPGKLITNEDYSFITHKRQITMQNTYFNEHFGRSDFEELDDKRRIGDAVAYLLKYIEKSGEKLVYSRGLPQFFISDVMDDDVVCTIGLEDKKLLLFDDFSCWDEGCFVGKVSGETIRQMRKSN